MLKEGAHPRWAAAREERRKRREAWGCGGSAGRRPHDHVRQARLRILDAVGSAPDECPWRAFDDPLVGDVARVFAQREHSHGVALLGDRPPHVLVEALGVYGTAYAGARAKDQERRSARLERERKKRERQQQAQRRRR